MAITITLPYPINVSLQAKPSDVLEEDSINSGGWDVIYFVRIDPVSKKQVGDVYRLGICTSIINGPNNYTISVEPDEKAQTPNTGDYIFFGKENKIGTSGVKGYHAVVELTNDSQLQAELYAVSSEITLSSK
tara:strand:- start:151 stop:546 length:396 start_codon:yes stop_codon:yes gene_type:complete